MVKWRYESLFPRFTPTGAACRRCRTPPGGGGRDLRHFRCYHQTLSQTETRKRSPVAKGDPRASCQESNGVAGPLASAVRGPSRCQPRRACAALGGRIWYPGEYGQYQPCASRFGLDTKKKTLRASEQNETTREAWREQAKQLERS